MIRTVRTRSCFFFLAPLMSDSVHRRLAILSENPPQSQRTHHTLRDFPISSESLQTLRNSLLVTPSYPQKLSESPSYPQSLPTYISSWFPPYHKSLVILSETPSHLQSFRHTLRGSSQPSDSLPHTNKNSFILSEPQDSETLLYPQSLLHTLRGSPITSGFCRYSQRLLQTPRDSPHNRRVLRDSSIL